MKNSLRAISILVVSAVIMFTACSSDEGETKSNSNMTTVVKVSTRGSVSPSVEINGSQQRSAQGSGGYYNFIADQTPPSANIISRAATSSSGKWAYMEQSVEEGSVAVSKTVKYSGVYAGDISENQNLILTVNSVADKQGLLVPVSKSLSFNFVIQETEEGVEFECEIPSVSYNSDATNLSYSAMGLPEPQGKNVFIEKELSSTDSFFTEESGNILINDVYNFISESAVIIDRTYNSVTGAAGVNVKLSACYSFNEEKNELYFKLNDISVSQRDEGVLEAWGVVLPDFINSWTKTYYVNISAAAEELVILIR